MAEIFTIAEVRGEKRANAIFVHSLIGNPLETWASPPPENAVWPKWLAEDLADDTVRARGRAALLAERGRMARLPLRYQEGLDIMQRQPKRWQSIQPRRGLHAR
ncbi:MAG: hypothetical protein L0Y57_04815 [Beijerinckiaceae bacterium]|nr:hypothetical protein [Beijerinckiaceae bacterium]MCI0600722.1 hypothetical protein [Beijerinckiaceae bacterium]